MAACAALLADRAGATNAVRESAFFVGSHGWHTSIIVPRAKVPRGAFPRGVTERTCGRYAYLEIGWGDRKFYTAPHPNVMRAGGLPADTSPVATWSAGAVIAQARHLAAGRSRTVP